jgi:hypothetical protein
MYKKHEVHDTNAKFTNNDEEQFATQFFNFMRKHQDIVISQVSAPQINLDIGTGFTPSCVGSAPDHQKYHVDDINCDVPPLSKDGQSKPGLLWGAITEVMTHNTSHTRIKYMKCSES